MSVVAVLVVALALALVGVFLTQSLRGRTRTIMGKTLAYGVGSVVITLLAVVAISVHWQQSDVLSIVGIGITVAITLLASESARGIRKLRVGIVIPSMRPFHRELRRGISDGIDSSRYVLIDPYNEGDFPEEDLSSFGFCLREALRRRADFLIICAPAVDLANSADLQSECLRLVRRGGHIVFIESVPNDDLLYCLRFVTTIISDSSGGAHQIATFLDNYLENRVGLASLPILLIPGPLHSRPASARLESAREALNGRQLEIRHTMTWTERETRQIVIDNLPKLGPVSAICCGNDDMAMGAAEAVAELGVDPPIITGHDGLIRSVVAIADPFSPLGATIRVPPRLFGQEAMLHLELVPPRWFLLLPGGFRRYSDEKPSKKIIPLTRANLITQHNARFLID